jgi:uncharacterized protein
MDIAQLIEALSKPSAYPIAPRAVEVHQTHISVVFVVDEFAYKIKKPIELGFVNYRSPERRRHFCNEEVRLNRRLASDVYLAVVPVTRRDATIAVEGTGEIIDWAVKMRRLPESATLRARLAGDIGATPIEELARRLARFYDSAESGPRVAARCSLESVARNSRENLAESAHQVGVTLSRATFDRLIARTEWALSRWGSLIDDRAQRGVPRDGHGDLRLDHIYWYPDRPPPDDWIAVDCIEFDERFRYADPVADVAFLAMELALEGRGDIGGSFVDEYLRAARDQDGRELLPFYRSYRAAVRGKVEGIKQAEPEITESERRAAQVRARALWLFALSELEEPGRRPCLVLIAGLPGAGKSTLSRDLATSAGFTVIRSDQVRKELASPSGTQRSAEVFGAGIYSSEWNDLTYDECLRRAENLIFDGQRVVVDASFREDWRRRLFLDAARRWGVTGCMLHCQVDPEIARHRLDHRRGDASDADWSIYEAISNSWDPISPKTLTAAHLIDTGGRQEQSLAQSLESLAKCGLVVS